jgi:hypothetical protein
MTNAELINERHNLARYKREMEKIRTARVKLNERFEKLDRIVRSLSRVDKIIAGVAVTAGGDTRNFSIRTQGDDIRRVAEVYTNAHTKKDYGLMLRDQIYVDRVGQQHKQNWCGVGWSYRDAVRFATQWVILGVPPTPQETKLGQFLGQFDKRGLKLTPLRLAAVEAAWMAGDLALATALVKEARPCNKSRLASVASP